MVAKREPTLGERLVAAARVGDTMLLRVLLEGRRECIDEYDPMGMTNALLVAGANRQHHAVQLLLDMGADPGVRDRNGRNLVMIAIDQCDEWLFQVCMEFKRSDRLATVPAGNLLNFRPHDAVTCVQYAKSRRRESFAAELESVNDIVVSIY